MILMNKGQQQEVVMHFNMNFWPKPLVISFYFASVYFSSSFLPLVIIKSMICVFLQV